MSWLSGTKAPPLEVVPGIDLTRGASAWCETASIAVTAQQKYFRAKTGYSVQDDDLLHVVKTCRKGSTSGKLRRIEGKAIVVPESTTRI
jgi:lipocalin